jgi:hypothetical protein
MQLKFAHAFAFPAALMLASCGGAADDSGDPGGDRGTQADGKAGDADLLGGSKSDAAISGPPKVNCDPSAYCSGPLIVRSDRLVLSKSDKDSAVLRGTLSFENRSNEDLRVALLGENFVVNFDNGASVEDYGGGESAGLGMCRDEGEECFNTEPETFRILSPGDSPAKLNVALKGYFESSLAPTMSQIEKGTMTLNAYTVEADGTKRKHRISLSDAAITNQISE